MDISNYYNSKHSVYKMNAGRRKHIIDLIPTHTKTVLDIGCGVGDFASVLHKKGYIVWGVDISEDALRQADEFLEDSFCFNVEDEQWSAELMSKKFDVIIASEVIEHLFHPELLLKKLKLLLNPGGKIIITTPNFLFWKNRLKMFFGNFKYQNSGLLDFGHIRFFTIDGARTTFLNVGLMPEKEHHFYPNLYKRGITFLGDLLPGVFAYQMIFLLSLQKS